jgi:uncharacterized membrane protein YidH (DUF202 family)
MRRADQQPVIPERGVIMLRVALVGIAYLIYRGVESSHGVVASAFIGFGFLLVAYAAVTRYGTWRRERSGLLQVGQTILGLGLVVTGLVMILT